MKRILLAAVMAVSALTAMAQQPVGTWSVQPKIGLNVASLTDGDDIDPRYGLAIGAEFQYQMTDVFALSIGALYSAQGCTGKIDESDYYYVNNDATLKMDYINIPILANFYLTKGLAVKIGLQPELNITAKTEIETSSAKVERDIEGEKSIALSIPIGLSYEFNKFVIDGRYNFGVTKIMDDADSKNSVFQFTLGYKFAL